MYKKMADYSHRIIENKLFIEDLNLGKISLTNSLESVLEDIQTKEGVDLKTLEIIEIDSEGEYSQVSWDGSKIHWKPVSSDLQDKYKQLMKRNQ